MDGGFGGVVCGAGQALEQGTAVSEFGLGTNSCKTYSVGNLARHGRNHHNAPGVLLVFEYACTVLGGDESAQNAC